MTHWKALAKPDCPYFGEQDLPEPGAVLTVTIRAHKLEEVMSDRGKQKKGVLYFAENIKPLILNVTNGKAIAKLYGKDADKWGGKRISLYLDPTVRFGKEQVGGIRVKAPIERTQTGAVKCAGCGQEIVGVGSSSAAQIASGTKKTYGRCLCWNCASKLRAEQQTSHAATETETETGAKSEQKTEA